MKNYTIYLIALLSFTGCDFLNTGYGECECTYTDISNVYKECECYFSNGNIREQNMWLSDSIQINEHYLYYPTGVLKEYNFYNLSGMRRFHRLYDEKGNLIHEEGDILSHNKIYKPKIKLGDSVIVEIFVANPPGTFFNIFGKYGEGRYDIYNKSDIKFMGRYIMYPEKSSTFTFLYEIEFHDTINNKTILRESNVNFEVISH